MFFICPSNCEDKQTLNMWGYLYYTTPLYAMHEDFNVHWSVTNSIESKLNLDQFSLECPRFKGPNINQTLFDIIYDICNTNSAER